ncbi:MAG: hypothetical protein ACLPHP_03310 [Candidatus Sulfotelmatobacter sp.]
MICRRLILHSPDPRCEARRAFPWVLTLATFFAAFGLSAPAQNASRVHGLWVWKGPSIVAAPQGAETLRDFCQSQGINEVYISVSSGDTMLPGDFPHLIDLLHRSGIHVEALLSNEEADQPGPHRDKLLDQARAIVSFNQRQPAQRFDGIHLDLEPQQRPENKGAGNLQFLPGLVDAYRAVRGIAEPVHLAVNADIQKKLLKGDAAQRKLLLSSLPRFTLMLYEISSPSDGKNEQEKIEKLQTESQKFLDTAYDGLQGPDLAKMVIGLRTPDYGELLPQMLAALDTAHGSNPHYAGWALHSYNDSRSNAH